MVEDVSPGPGPVDEGLEKREAELGLERARLGGLLAELQGRSRGLLARLLPWRRRALHRQAAPLAMDLTDLLGRLSEVREVRRGLLGLGPSAHIRSRATPNFVRENPEYARTVQEAEETGEQGR